MHKCKLVTESPQRRMQQRNVCTPILWVAQRFLALVQCQRLMTIESKKAQQGSSRGTPTFSQSCQLKIWQYRKISGFVPNTGTCDGSRRAVGRKPLGFRLQYTDRPLGSLKN